MRLDLAGVAVVEVVSMDPCVTCTDFATWAFYVQYGVCPGTCERMRLIQLRAGSPVPGRPRTATADAAAAAPRTPSPCVAISHGRTTLVDRNVHSPYVQRSEAMTSGSRP